MEESGRLAIYFIFFIFILRCEAQPTATKVSVGVIVDRETDSGKKSFTSIQMAVEDFYANHRKYMTRIDLRVLDTKQTVVDAAAAAEDLLKNSNVAAIIGPESSSEAEFVVHLGDATQTPVISYAASDNSLSVTDNRYFIRATVSDSAQSLPIAALLNFYGWHEFAFIYEDSGYGSGFLPSVIDALQSDKFRVTSLSAIAPSDSDEYIINELVRPKKHSTWVFIVHMTPSLASRIFLLAAKARMMEEGYAWIVTDRITNLADKISPSDMYFMQGVIGVKPHVPRSKKLSNFASRWITRFQRENPVYNYSYVEPSLFQLWAYDATQAVAAAVEKAFLESKFNWRRGGSNRPYIPALGVFEAGPQLLAAIRNTSFRGLCGEYRLAGGELNTPSYEIINFLGTAIRTVGFCSPTKFLSRELNSTDEKLRTVIWPGEGAAVPNGPDTISSKKMLRIAVPVKNGLNPFVNIRYDPVNDKQLYTGYCIEVFEAVMREMPFPVRYEFLPFNFKNSESYDNLVQQVYYKKFDAVVGDITILASRMDYVVFTLPYTQSSVVMVVPQKRNITRNPWIFLKPLNTDLWIGSLACFLSTGFIIWAIEHRINPVFSHQIGNALFFVFSILFFAHRENLKSNMSRLLIIIWLFVVLILMTSYTASLTSMLTVPALTSTVISVDQLVRSNARIGYQERSFVEERLRRLGFIHNNLYSYRTPELYQDALLKGPGEGGVDAVFDELPYLQLFLSEHCADFTTISPALKTDGLGFVFPKGSPLAIEVSRALLRVMESDEMIGIEKRWFGNQRACQTDISGSIGSPRLDFWSFGGLFLVTGSVSVFSLLVYIAVFLWSEWYELNAIAITVKERGGSVWSMMAAWAGHYDNFKRESSTTGCLQSPSSLSGLTGAGVASRETSVSGGRTSTTEKLPDDLVMDDDEIRRAN